MRRHGGFVAVAFAVGTASLGVSPRAFAADGDLEAQHTAAKAIQAEADRERALHEKMREIRLDAFVGYSFDAVGKSPGLAIGGRGTYVFPDGLTLGILFHDRLDVSETYQTTDVAHNPVTVTVQNGFIQFGPEIGYEVRLTPVSLRPYFGAGYISYTTYGSDSNLPGEISRHGPAFWPGFLGSVDIGPVALGADMRVMAQAVDSWRFALSFAGTAGVKL